MGIDMKVSKHTIDARGKSLGRVASSAAKLLRGKMQADFLPYVMPEISVDIINAKEVAIPPKKWKGKVYIRYSGYPGGQSKASLLEVVEKKGYREIFEQAVYGMLPRNRLRKSIMKNLTIKE